MPRFAGVLGACVAGGLLVLPVPAFANLSVRLIYVRDASAQTCPDEAELRAAVRRRIGYEAFYPWAKTTIVVEVTREEHTDSGSRASGSFVARVQLADTSGVARGTQELHSAGDCRSAVDAAALAISIALEAEEAAQTTPSSPTSSAASHDSSKAADASEASPAPADPVPAPTAVTLATERGPSTEIAARPRESGVRYRVVAGVDGFAAFGEAPDVLAGAGLWAEVRRGIASLGIEVQGNIPDAATVSNGDRATILFFAAVVDPCAHIGRAFFCAVGSLGLMSAEGGSNVSVPRKNSAPAVAVGPRAGIEWPLGGGIALRVRGDFLVNVVHPGIATYRPDGSAYPSPWEMPIVAGTLAAGVAYRFP